MCCDYCCDAETITNDEKRTLDATRGLRDSRLTTRLSDAIELIQHARDLSDAWLAEAEAAIREALEEL